MAHRNGNIICLTRGFNANVITTNLIYFNTIVDYTYSQKWLQSVDADLPAVGSDLAPGASLLVKEGPRYAGMIVAPFNCRLVGIAMNYQQYNKEANATYFKIAAMHCEFSQNEIESGHATWRNIGELQSVDRDGSTSPTSYIGKKVTLLNSSNGDLNTGDLLGLV